MDIDFSSHPALGVYNQLGPAEAEWLEIVHFAPKNHLIRENERKALNLYLILKGICEAHQTATRQDYLFLSYKLLPGEYVGLHEIISAGTYTRNTSIVAKTPVTTMRIPGSLFLEWQTSRPKLYNHIISNVLGKQFSVRNFQVNCVTNDTLASGAYCLLYLYHAYRTALYEADYNGPVKIWDTRQEIGAALAKDIRSVDRIISEFRSEGLISVVKGKTYIDQEQSQNMQALYETRT